MTPRRASRTSRNISHTTTDQIVHIDYVNTMSLCLQDLIDQIDEQNEAKPLRNA
jgi:hypothetical protein